MKSNLHSPVFGMQNKLYRVCWRIVYFVFLRFSPPQLFKFRSFMINCMGSKCDINSRVYPSANLWSPKNLTIGSDSTIGPSVSIYNQDHITIGRFVIISQGAYLCASTHDYEDPLHPLLLRPICIEDHAWICSEAFIGPGVTVGEGAVIGARAVLTKDADPWSVYAGNPAKKIKSRRCFIDE